AYPEIFYAEFAKVLASDREWIEIVFLQISAKLATALLVFPPKKAYCEEKCRHDNRRDDVDTELALQGIDHGMSTFCAVATGLPAGRRSQRGFFRTRFTAPWLQRFP